MGGQHSQKVAVKKPKAAKKMADAFDKLMLAIDPPKAPRKKKTPVVPVNPLAGERRPRIKTKMKFKRWV